MLPLFSTFLGLSLALRFRESPLALDQGDVLSKIRQKFNFPTISINPLVRDILADGHNLDLTAYKLDERSVLIEASQSRPDLKQFVRLNFTRSFTQLGWNVAEIYLPERTAVSMYLAGYIEALVSAGEIGNWYSTNAAAACKTKEAYLRPRADEFSSNLLFVDSLDNSQQPNCPDIQGFTNTAVQFWAQLIGLIDGYNFRSLQQLTADPNSSGMFTPSDDKALPGMGMLEFFCLQLEAQLSGVPDRCSAVVAVGEDDSVMVAHSTWERPSEAVPKLFRFLVTESESLQLSSYPGMIWSSDDWLVKSSGLVMLETSLDLKPNTAGSPRFPDFVKTMVAAALADSPDGFARYMSTCDQNTFDLTNGQWLAVDKKTKEVVVLQEGRYLSKTQELLQKRAVGSFNGQDARRTQELAQAGSFKTTEDLWNFFDSNPFVKPFSPGNGAMDVKMTSSSMSGSIVRAGPARVAGDRGFNHFDNLTANGGMQFKWKDAPLVRMIPGQVSVIANIN